MSKFQLGFRFLLGPALTVLSRQLTKFYCKMAKNNGVPLKQVVSVLETFAPVEYAELWDNVGLILEPYNTELINKILLTNDLTEGVMDEALQSHTNMIISYHPPIFTPLKKITQSNWKERIITKCLKKSIAIYSPHTAWDTINGGVNDWLASALPIKDIKPIQPMRDYCTSKAGRGRIFSTNILLNDAIARVQNHIGLDVHVALATGHNLKTNIETVAICAGSGTSLLRGITADLYITGEMSHHELLDANHNGTSVILCNHSNSERGFLANFKPKLQEMLKNNCEIIVSKTDADPLKTFFKS